MGYQFRIKGRAEFPWELLEDDACDFASLRDEHIAAGDGFRALKMISLNHPSVSAWEKTGWTVDRIEELTMSATSNALGGARAHGR